MPPPRRRKWSRRTLTLYFTVTVFGGTVLIIFLFLVYLLYWMNARVPLPKAELLIPPQATAFVVFRMDAAATPSRAAPRHLADLVSGGAPTQVLRLAEKGLRDPKCPVQIVAATVPAGDRKETTLAVSLGRYPGIFRMVRRDMERRCKGGSLTVSLRYHNEKAVFTLAAEPDSLNVLSLASCTVLRTSSDKPMEELMDRLLEGASGGGPRAVPEFEDATIAQAHPFAGWAENWQGLPLGIILSGEVKSDLEDFTKALAEDVPGLSRAEEVVFQGTLDQNGFARLTVTLQPGPSDDAETLAQELSEGLSRAKRDRVIATSDATLDNSRIRFLLDVGTGGK